MTGPASPVSVTISIAWLAVTCKNSHNELTITTYRLRRKITNGEEKTEKYKMFNHQTTTSSPFSDRKEIINKF